MIPAWHSFRRWWPYWRVGHHFAPFPLPFTPSLTDEREWLVEIDPRTAPLNKPLPENGVLKVSLHRILIETGIAQSLATSAWDPTSWYALYRYGPDFAGTAPDLRFRAGVQSKDPRLTAVASEEIATGITCYILRDYFKLDHIADAYACIQQGELQYVNPTSHSRPDYFCEDQAGETVIAESKGATGTSSTITGPIKNKGWAQVMNVDPVNKKLRKSCNRVVIGTHFCVKGTHARSETTTLIMDPEGGAGREATLGSDTVVRIAYAKALRFMGQDFLAERLLMRQSVGAIFNDLSDDNLPRVSNIPFLPLGITPFGDAIGLHAPTAQALFSEDPTLMLPALTKTLTDVSKIRLEPEFTGFIMTNGVMVVSDPELLK